MPINILTRSGGEINLVPRNSGIKGHELYLHVDQTANIHTGEGDAGILINTDECKKLILLLNEYVSYVEGKNYIAIIDYTNSDGKTADHLDLGDGSIKPTGDTN